MVGYRVGVVLHPRNASTESLTLLSTWARSHDGEVVARARDESRVVPGIRIIDDEQFVDTVDGIVSLGGDGTMLGAMRLVAARPVPVLGVNHGNLGFLVEVEPHELSDALDRLVAGDMAVEPYHGLRVRVDQPGGGAEDKAGEHIAFNDLVLACRTSTGGVSADLSINDARYGYYRCDTLVLCTPAGSTAYNYAAGGPVVSPSTPVTVVTAVAPMSGISRSVVLGPDERVHLRVSQGAGRVTVEVDGVGVGEVAADALITVVLRPDAGRVVRIDPQRHGQRSRVKLSLLDLPLRRDQLLELVPEEVRQRQGWALADPHT